MENTKSANSSPDDPSAEQPVAVIPQPITSSAPSKPHTPQKVSTSRTSSPGKHRVAFQDDVEVAHPHVVDTQPAQPPPKKSSSAAPPEPNDKTTQNTNPAPRKALHHPEYSSHHAHELSHEHETSYHHLGLPAVPLRQREYIIGQETLEMVDPVRDADADGGLRPEEMVRKRAGKYVEIPHVLDGFLMLNKAPAEDPEEVYSLDISGCDLRYVIEDDLSLFVNLHTLKAGENCLPFARLGVLSALKHLILPCNGVTGLDLDVEGRFRLLENLDLSYNSVEHSAIIVLATLPCLRSLDLTSNGLTSLPPELKDMSRWRDRVIELVLPPAQLAELDARLLGGWQTRRLSSRAGFTESAKSTASRLAGYARGMPTGVSRPQSLEPFAAAQTSAPVTEVVRPESKAVEQPTASTGQANALPQSKPLEIPRPVAEDPPEPGAEATDEGTTSNGNGGQRETAATNVAVDEAVTVTLDQDDAGSAVESEQSEGSGENSEEQSENPLGEGDEEEQQGANPDHGTNEPSSGDRAKDEHGAANVPAQTAEPAGVTAEPAGVTAEPTAEEPPSTTAGDGTTYNASNTFGEGTSPTSMANPPPPPPMEGPGFRTLENLSLENNKLASIEVFEILGVLPGLRVLNMNRNRITDLSFLVPSNLPKSADYKRSVTPSPEQLRYRYEGFRALEELRVAFNQIASPEGLMGIVWLPKLARVYLQGNPVMTKVGGRIGIRGGGTAGGSEEEVLGYIDFNPLVILPNVYGITVADTCYQEPPTLLEDNYYALAPTSKGPSIRVFHRKRHAQTMDTYSPSPASRFLGHVHRKGGPPSIHPLNHVASHTVSNAGDPYAWGLPRVTRALRRAYHYSDDDIMRIIKEGTIPSAKELVRYAKRRERDMRRHDMDEDDSDYSEGWPESQHSVRLAPLKGDHGELRRDTVEPSDMFYDPEAKDDTFLTGVHITGGLARPRQPSSSGYSSRSLTDSAISGGEEEGDSDATQDEDDGFPLPSGIQASVRALRHALSNPVSYWRIVEESYAKPTFASKRRVTEARRPGRADHGRAAALAEHGARWRGADETQPMRQTSVPVAADAPKADTDKGHEGEGLRKAQDMGEQFDYSGSFGQLPSAAPLDGYPQTLYEQVTHKLMYGDGPQGAVTYKSPKRAVGARGKNAATGPNRQRFHTPSAVVAMKRAAGAGRLRPRDEFDEMRDMMSSVDQKIQLVEANLATVLGNNALQRHLPHSRKLFEEIQREYARIERKYSEEARAAVAAAQKLAASPVETEGARVFQAS
ncbi:X-ray radiation resistance-associated protein 1 [Borealophlyctis nickersoniae]|nr:X-ray radiation resistance-associated protein 1 [Borealophlyctis nickersoniae]